MLIEYLKTLRKTDERKINTIETKYASKGRRSLYENDKQLPLNAMRRRTGFNLSDQIKQLSGQKNFKRQYEFPPDVVLRNRLMEQKLQRQEVKTREEELASKTRRENMGEQVTQPITFEEAVEEMKKCPPIRSELLEQLLITTFLKDHIKVLSDIAFDAVDADGSGGLDQGELAELIEGVARKMGLNPPSEEDLANILMELDEDFDGVVDKDEFLNLIMIVITKMLESEEEDQ